MEVWIALRCTLAWRDAANAARLAFRQAKESGRSFVFRVPRRFFAGLECQNERAEICTRTSVQVAIGLFPIDSVRSEFLLLFSLLSFTHCLHLPFTCTFRSSSSPFFSLGVTPLSPSLPPLSFSLPPSHPPPSSMLLAFPFFCRFFFTRRLFAISTWTRLRKPCINRPYIGETFGDFDTAADR